jgi:hypothetical protein
MKRFAPILVLGLVGLAMAGWLHFRPTAQQAALRTRQLATEGLAAYLAERFAGERALVIANPFTQRPGLAKGIYAQEQAGVHGVQRGFGNKIKLEAVVFPELKAEALQAPQTIEIDPASPTPLSFLVAEDAFDKLLQAHPDCTLVVSLIGLPWALDRVAAWQAHSPVKFGLLFPDLRMLGGPEAVRQAVHQGKLAAFVLHRPGAPPEQASWAKDARAEFERRFILVTPQNVDEIVATYPQWFQPVKR